MTHGAIWTGSECRKQARPLPAGLARPRTGRPVQPVDVSNHAARRLYQHLGYHDWGHGLVIDHWDETDPAGTALKTNANPCHYLTKPIE